MFLDHDGLKVCDVHVTLFFEPVIHSVNKVFETFVRILGRLWNHVSNALKSKDIKTFTI